MVHQGDVPEWCALRRRPDWGKSEYGPPKGITVFSACVPLLDREIERLYVLPEDLKLARIPDSQGLGGSSHTEAAS